MGDGLVWVPLDTGHCIAIDGGRLVCRNAKGQRLASVPKAIRSTEAAARLMGLADWLADHALECRRTVEGFMLRGSPVSRALLTSVWADAAWREVLLHAVVEDAARRSRGLLLSIDAARGVGVVDLDGETRYLDASDLYIPHPVTLAERDDLRALAAELGLTQKLLQLHRETFQKPADLAPDRETLSDFAGGRFEPLVAAHSRAKDFGFRVTGGSAVTRVLEGGRSTEARYWLGDGDPLDDTVTAELRFVGEDQRALPLSTVGPVAFSEGVRMATLIFAGRLRETEHEDE